MHDRAGKVPLRPDAVAMVALLLLATAATAATSVQPTAHPNHYVLLIDASESVTNPVRAAIFRAAIATAVERTYGDGFGVLPPLDPEQDLLTIEHFGSVTEGKPEDALNHLKDVDFLRDVIHPVIRREAHVAAERAQKLAIPTTHYHLTLLVWSVPLGVKTIATAVPDQAPANRTFLIRVTDLLVNDATVRMEQELIENKGRKDRLDTAHAAIDGIAANYVIGNARGEGRPLYTERFGHRADQADSVTLHVWEVRSRTIDEWAIKAAQMKRLATGDLAWGDREGDAVHGVMTVRATADFQSTVLASSIATTVQPAGSGTSVPWSPGQAVTIPVSVINCNAEPVPLTIAAHPTFTDPLLGTMQYTLIGTESLPLPIPPSCGMPFRILMAGILAVAVLLILATAYYLLYTRRWTRVEVRRPAGLQSWRLRWDIPTLVDDIVLPDETEALRVELPAGAHRMLLYRNAQLVLRSDPPGEFQWDDTESETMPIRDAGAVARVRRLKTKPHAASLHIEVLRKKRAAIFERAPQTEEIQ